MFIRPLIQFRQTVETALNGMTNISKPFVTFFIETMEIVTLSIDPCFINKAGKKTPGISYFWSGCASAMKRGLEILGIAAVAYFSKKSFADGLHSLGFHLISRFRDDVRLRYIYRGPKVRRRGR